MKFFLRFSQLSLSVRNAGVHFAKSKCVGSDRSPASGEIRGTRGTASTRGEDRQRPHVTHRGRSTVRAQKSELEGREKPSPGERVMEHEEPPGYTPTYPLPRCWQNLTADAPESFP